jgi:hypothetical protein
MGEVEIMIFKRFLLFGLLVTLYQVTPAAIDVGDLKGLVTLTEVFDYQCVHCHEMQDTINQVIKDNTHIKLRLIPVAIVNNNSLIEAASSYVVAKRTDYFENYHQYLMTGAISSEKVYHALVKMGVNMKSFVLEMHQPWVLNQMNEGMALLNKYHSGTPLTLVCPTNNVFKCSVFRGEVEPQLINRAIKEMANG